MTTTESAEQQTQTTEDEDVAPQRIHMGEPEYFAIAEFLEDEAFLLDSGKLLEWLGLMAPELRYQMPVRSTRDLVDGSEFSDGMFMFDETILTLGIKATRLAATMSAWAEKPPSRTRRHLSGIRVFKTADNEYEVTSSLLVLRNRYQEHFYEIISARRVDVLRRQDDGLKIVKRLIYSDQATLGTQNLAIFL
jgi:3-phenylpropionate/cinnamic acid dioxygenase small subunit